MVRLDVCLAAAGLFFWPATARATTYQVGAGMPYPTLASLPRLVPGDVVEINPGTYNEVKRWTDSGAVGNPITIRGVGSARPVIDASGRSVDGVLPNPRAVFQIEGGNIVIENLELVNARNGDNGSGIRVTGSGAVNVVIRGCKIDNCDMGIMSDGNDNLLIDASEIASNGTSSFSGYSHNLYLGGQKTTIQYSYIHDSLYGQNVKSRGHYTELLYNFIADSQDGEVGLVDAAETSAPNSNAVMIGNVVVSKPRMSGWNNGRFVWFGQDQGGAHNGTLYLINNTFMAGDARIYFVDANASGASIVASNNIFYNSNTITGGNGPLSGSNNCVPSTAAVPSGLGATVMAADLGLASPSSRDFHLLAGSPCRDAAVGAPTYTDGAGGSQSGVPMFEYVVDLQQVPRPSDGRLDIGAYEYGAVVVPDGGGGADGSTPRDGGGGSGGS
ncbi:MAG TPA: hypothetical protein VKN99_20980, partial [Polyangia bacterium]|nr:hypothetical protein [Polyangia bacterium]